MTSKTKNSGSRASLKNVSSCTWENLRGDSKHTCLAHHDSGTICANIPSFTQQFNNLGQTLCGAKKKLLKY